MTEVKQTIKERIKSIAEKYKIDSPLFLAEVMDLVERGAYPKNFCPACQERMTYDPAKGYLLCINCGYEDVEEKEMPAVTIAKPAGQTITSTPANTANIPKGVQDLINDVPKPTAPRNPGRADKIARLKNAMDGGPITAEDDAIVRGQDPNIKGGINWS